MTAFDTRVPADKHAKPVSRLRRRRALNWKALTEVTRDLEREFCAWRAVEVLHRSVVVEVQGLHPNAVLLRQSQHAVLHFDGGNLQPRYFHQLWICVRTESRKANSLGSECSPQRSIDARYVVDPEGALIGSRLPICPPHPSAEIIWRVQGPFRDEERKTMLSVPLQKPQVFLR